jgi:hypothetical protein
MRRPRHGRADIANARAGEWQQPPPGKRARQDDGAGSRALSLGVPPKGRSEPTAQPTAQQRALAEQQVQLEVAILSLTPAQVAALPLDHAAMYWKLKKSSR